MDRIFGETKQKVQSKYPSIIFPEGHDERILKAACKLSQEGILKPILIGNIGKISINIKNLNLKFRDYEILDPFRFPNFDMMVDSFLQCTKNKDDEETVRSTLLKPNFFSTMLVHTNIADGLVGGAVYTTRDIIRPALKIIGTKQGVNKISGIFIMTKGSEKYIFADCAVNISPSSEDLAEIAVLSADTAKMFDIDPKIALLSFSTKGSGRSLESEKVSNAVSLVKIKDPNLVVDGELQFDTALIPSIAKKKAPNSSLNGDANIFIFPNLDSGNISYKITQILGGYSAVGPILQGLNKPVNDLSRGCSTDDVYKLSIITAMQGLY
ncbi:phosphate acetyltransferase [Alkalihalobacillus deserti]|uniref:phosphate acetyltransferase n=1 Tax=Alkalihalobacillus deserti TaxID=2879466 RepID=UPI001D15668B|nr:phosphate acetyltransferase [Alkalihalobacillus deserti]